MAEVKEGKGKTRKSYAHTAAPHGMDARRRKRQDEADTRNAEYSVLTPEDRLKKLDAKLGVGVGAAKQRKKLKAKMNQK